MSVRGGERGSVWEWGWGMAAPGGGSGYGTGGRLAGDGAGGFAGVVAANGGLCRECWIGACPC